MCRVLVALNLTSLEMIVVSLLSTLVAVVCLFFSCTLECAGATNIEEYATCLCTGDGSGGQNSTSFIPHHFVVRSDPYLAFSYSPCRCGSNGKSHVSFSFAITVPVNQGWVGVGFGKTEQPKSAMVDADIIFLWRRGNVNYFKDSYSVNFNPAPDAVDDLFGKSWSAFTDSGSKSPLQTFYFSRKQYTGDENQDNALVFGKQLVAFTASNTIPTGSLPTSMPPWKAWHVFDLSNRRAGSTGSRDNVLLLHGLVMGVSWVVIIPMSLIHSRYFKHHDKWWLLIHKITGKVGSGGAFSFILVAMMQVNQFKFSTFHNLCGFVLFALMILLSLSGFVSRSGYKHEVQGDDSKYPKYRGTRIFHFFIGWIVTILGFVQTGAGIRKYFFDDGTAFGTMETNFHVGMICFYLWSVFLLVLVVVLELRGRTFGHYKKSLWIQNIGVVHEGDKYHEHIKKITLNSVTSRARNSVHTREVLLNQISAVANVGLATTAGVVDKTNDKTNGSECSDSKEQRVSAAKHKAASMLIDNPLQHGRRVKS